MLKMALHQSEETAGKQIAKKTRGFFEDERRRSWSMMRKKQSTKPISDEAKNAWDTFKAGLVSNQKRVGQ